MEDQLITQRVRGRNQYKSHNVLHYGLVPVATLSFLKNTKINGSPSVAFSEKIKKLKNCVLMVGEQVIYVCEVIMWPFAGQDTFQFKLFKHPEETKSHTHMLYTHGIMYAIYLSQCKGHDGVPLFTVCVCVCLCGDCTFMTSHKTKLLPQERSFGWTRLPVAHFHKHTQWESTLVVVLKSGGQKTARKREQDKDRENIESAKRGKKQIVLMRCFMF